ncbi:CbrC family protein [Delftia acidovorans]|nr:CbrC family protein [Delftia acidovorans]
MNQRIDPSTSQPGASNSDIAACEAVIGARLPDWLRERLLAGNGWEVDDTAGATRREWRFLPVLDRSDRKRRSRTAEDIAWHTQRLRQQADVPVGAVVVARAWSETTRLILLPDLQSPDRLGAMLWMQNGVAVPLQTPVDPLLLGAQPEPAARLRLRPRSELPVFRYHPDPVATGSIQENHALACPCCGRVSGWVYATTPYGLGEQPSDLCPWCIADGSAASRFGSGFVSDLAGEVPGEVADEVNLRTPGFISWQGEQWLTHCGDAAAFLGPVGWEALKDLPDAQASLLEDGCDKEMLALMRKDGDLTAYLFRCLHCGVHLAYADAS